MQRDAARLTHLASLPLTYSEIGASLTDDLPTGYQHLRRSRIIKRSDFDAAKQDIWDWQIQRRSGLSVLAAGTVALHTIVESKLRLGPITVKAPCRVVAVIDEPDRAGFAYGTLQGHPECGEEAFILERNGDELRLAITAFSRSATLVSKVGAPLARRIQDRVTERYLRALDESGPS